MTPNRGTLSITIGKVVSRRALWYVSQRKSASIHANKGTQMKTRKEWQALKKKHAIPSGAVKNISFGDSLEKCAKVVNGNSKPADILRAVGKFQITTDKYQTGLKKLKDKAPFNKSMKFFKELNDELAAAEKAADSDDGMVVNIQPEKAGAKSQTINEAAKSISKNRSKGKDSPSYDAKNDQGKHKKEKVKGKDKVDFAEAGLKGPIVLLAHGAEMGNAKVPGKVHAKNFGNKNAGAIVSYLKKTLPLSYSGVVYLDGCYTAAGGSPQNFMLSVYKGLVKAGYMYLQVKGNLGVAATVAGKEVVTWPELEKQKKVARKAVKQLTAERDKLMKKYGAKILQFEAGIDKIMSQARSEQRYSLEELTKPERKMMAKLREYIAKEESKRDSDSKIKQIDQKITELNEEIASCEIEEFVGTAGPEKRPPKR